MKIEEWDVIEFKDIKQNDTLEVSKTSDLGSLVVRSEVEYWCDGRWRLKNGYDVINRYPGFGTTVEIKRLRPEYEFPTGVGAVIEAGHSEGGRMIKFVHYRPHWIPVGGGAAWSQGNICQSYTRFNTLSEGIIL